MSVDFNLIFGNLTVSMAFLTNENICSNETLSVNKIVEHLALKLRKAKKNFTNSVNWYCVSVFMFMAW